MGRSFRAAMLAAATALPALSAAAPAGAQQIVSTGDSFVSPSVAVGERAADGSRSAALVLDVKPGWKTYWRNPGESGVPPEFDWSASGNLAEIRVDWPRPEVFDSFGMRTLGYGGRVVLPLTLVPVDPSLLIDLRLEARLGVCKDICVFEEAVVALAVAPFAAGEDAALIAAARARVPPPALEAGVGVVSCRVTGMGENRAFAAVLSLPASAGEDAVVVLEGPAESWFHDETVTRDGDRLSVEATLSLFTPEAWIGRSDIRMTLLAGDLSADIRGCAATTKG